MKTRIFPFFLFFYIEKIKHQQLRWIPHSNKMHMLVFFYNLILFLFKWIKNKIYLWRLFRSWFTQDICIFVCLFFFVCIELQFFKMQLLCEWTFIIENPLFVTIDFFCVFFLNQRILLFFSCLLILLCFFLSGFHANQLLFKCNLNSNANQNLSIKICMLWSNSLYLCSYYFFKLI